MSNNKQSSVDWLIDQVEDFIGLIPKDIIEQARARHKQDTINSFCDGRLSVINRERQIGSEYYVETFGGEL
jgi:hypothetical protein